METQYDNSDIPDDRHELDIAKAIVRQWDNHDKFRVVAGEPNGEPEEVRVARALLRINHEYGCEVRDPCGTIWQHAAKVEKENTELKESLEQFRAYRKSDDRRIMELQQERDEMWRRDFKLLEAMQNVIDMSFDNTKIHREWFSLHYMQNGEKVPPGWRVVEAIRGIAIEAIEAYQKTVRETIERNKNGMANS